MKSLILSLSYTKRTRWLLVILIIMMTVSILSGILVMGQIQYLSSSYNVVSSTKHDPDKVYYYQELLSTADLVSGSYVYRDTTSLLVGLLSENPSIEHIYTIKTVNPLAYNDYGISILLYEPELLTLFPSLSQHGVIFTEPTSCVLGSRVFSDVAVGETIDLTFSRPSEHSKAFMVSGQLSYPYQYMIFEISSTHAYVEDLFQSGHIIIMQDNQETQEMFSEITTIRNGTSFFFTFSEGASQQQIDTALAILEPYGIVTTLSDILARSETSLHNAYIQNIPKPLFYLVISFFSYFSTLILIFKKKEHHLAIYHLCGGSQRKCISSILLTFSAVSLIPTVISTIIVLFIPYLDWIGMIELHGFVIDNRCLIVIAISFLVTQLIAFIATWSQFRHHTPLSLLRGTQK